MSPTQQQINPLIQRVYPRTYEIRRDLHRNPEVDYTDFWTSDVILGELEQLEYEIKQAVYHEVD